MTVAQASDGTATEHIKRHSALVCRLATELAIGDHDAASVDRAEVLGQAMLTLAGAMLRLCMESNRPQALREVAFTLLKSQDLPPEAPGKGEFRQ